MLRKLFTKIKMYRDKIEGTRIFTDLSSYRSDLHRIRRIRRRLINLPDNKLAGFSRMLQNRIAEQGSAHSTMCFAYALVTEAISRTLHVEPFDEQIIGGIALHRGHLIEMQTGEGKTFTAIYPAYLSALSKKGVHVITFNDYLAKRDALWAKNTYALLGVSCSYIEETMDISKRSAAYSSDIIYLTARECGFDYLRDSISYTAGERVGRPFSYAIIDEADSILIDEARIPLVIADANADPEAELDMNAISDIVRNLTSGQDYNFDPYTRNIYLTESGLTRCESLLGCNNIYESGNDKLLISIQSALHAEKLLHRDKDYVVKNSNIFIIDEHTGRIAHNRKWPDSLHRAVEAKEGLNSGCSSRILNTITMQHLFRLFPKLCGMTATAHDSEEEFRTFYNLDIVVIPNHKRCIRIDRPDTIFETKKEKYSAIIDEIISINKSGRPQLTGTQSVKESEYLASELSKRGIHCTILNAKNDEHEASVIAKAGKKNAVTISTNMAGRGTDIKLGPDNIDEFTFVNNAGGLHVIGCGRFECRRIDNQLRGRSARQGDNGSTHFFMSLEDDMFVKYRLDELLTMRLLRNTPSEKLSENRHVTNEIDRIQRIIGGQNLDLKTDLFKYSLLLEQQRSILFTIRNNILETDDATAFFLDHSPDTCQALQMNLSLDNFNVLCRTIRLSVIDSCWSEFIITLMEVKENIHLQRLGGKNPLFEYRRLSIDMFDKLSDDIDKRSIELFDSITVEKLNMDHYRQKLRIPSATWTYFVNDNPFEQYALIDIGTNAALSYGALFTWPIFVLYAIVRKFIKRRNINK